MKDAKIILVVAAVAFLVVLFICARSQKSNFCHWGQYYVPEPKNKMSCMGDPVVIRTMDCPLNCGPYAHCVQSPDGNSACQPNAVTQSQDLSCPSGGCPSGSRCDEGQRCMSGDVVPYPYPVSQKSVPSRGQTGPSYSCGPNGCPAGQKCVEFTYNNWTCMPDQMSEIRPTGHKSLLVQEILAKEGR